MITPILVLKNRIGVIFMKRAMCLLLIFCLLLTGCSERKQEQTQQEPAKQEELPTRQEQNGESSPEESQEPTTETQQDPVEQASALEGILISPDGRFEVRTEGTGSLYANGMSAPEFLQVTDTESGEVLWEIKGSLYHRVLWSPDSRYMALTYGGRTWNQVLILHTETWASWDFTLPDGRSIPDYDFLPEEDWCRWTDEAHLLLTVGRGGDAGPQRTYRCGLFLRESGLEGVVLEETVTPIEGNYDFSHDGTTETLELTTVWNPEITDQAEWYELRIRQGDEVLWIEEAAEAHVGWNSLFALRMDGEDFLLRYNPYMNQGAASYQFELFTLEDNREVVVHRERVEFDVNFGSPIHQSFDPEAIANFLWAARTLIQGSHVLLSTQGFRFLSDVPAEAFEHSMFGEALNTAKTSAELAEALRVYETETIAQHAPVSSRKEIANGYDFNHNGIPEKVWLVTVVEDAGSGSSHWNLEITEQKKTIWTETAHAAHAGWNTVFAVRSDGEDYLLQYHPTMYQGFCTYSYQVFSLDPSGERLPLRDASVEFDISWGSPLHSFDADAVLTFVEQLNGELEEGGALLLNTDDSVSAMDPESPQETLPWLQEGGLCPGFRYEETKSLAENLRMLELAMSVAAEGGTYGRG